MKYSETVILDELREILKLIKKLSDKVSDLADKIYESENERG